MEMNGRISTLAICPGLITVYRQWKRVVRIFFDVGGNRDGEIITKSLNPREWAVFQSRAYNLFKFIVAVEFDFDASGLSAYAKRMRLPRGWSKHVFNRREPLGPQRVELKQLPILTWSHLGTQYGVLEAYPRTSSGSTRSAWRSHLPNWTFGFRSADISFFEWVRSQVKRTIHLRKGGVSQTWTETSVIGFHRRRRSSRTAGDADLS